MKLLAETATLIAQPLRPVRAHVAAAHLRYEPFRGEFGCLAYEERSAAGAVRLTRFSRKDIAYDWGVRSGVLDRWGVALECPRDGASDEHYRDKLVAAYDAFVASQAKEANDDVYIPESYGASHACGYGGLRKEDTRALAAAMVAHANRNETVESLARAIFDRRLLAEALKHAEGDGPRARSVLDKMWHSTKPKERTAATQEALELLAMRASQEWRLRIEAFDK